MKVLIVDDEANARENLRLRLKKIDPEVEIIGEAQNAEEAYQYITEFDLDLVFLDIEMPVENGFQLLEKLDAINFEIVFVTAYNDYALKAFNHLALAYITKPIDNILLTRAYEKVKKAMGRSDNQDLIRRLTGMIGNMNSSGKIAIPIESGLQMIELDSVVSLEADEGYVVFELKNGKRIISSKRLSYFEKQLSNSQFIRIHRSFIVNKDFIEYYHKIGFVKLTTGKELPVSKALRSEVRNLLKGG